MTLIAAWVTEDFRIVASDSKITGENGLQIKGSPQKVFVSENIAVAFFGEFGFRINQFRKMLVNNKMTKENWNYKKLLSEIQNILESEYLDKWKFDFDFHEEHESNLLVFPTEGKVKVIRIKFHKIQKEFILDEYKRDYQVKEIGNLFFSEQHYVDGELDLGHQRELLKHFISLKGKTIDDLNVNIETPNEVKILIQLVYDAMDSENKLINRSNIGGDKVYYAFSYIGCKWKQGAYIGNTN